MSSRSSPLVLDPIHQQHISGWRQSGLSKVDYCKRQGIRFNQLMYWQQVLRKTGKSKEPAFVKANILPALVEAKKSLARVLVGNRAVMEIDTAADPAWVARLVMAMGGMS